MRIRFNINITKSCFFRSIAIEGGDGTPRVSRSTWW